MEEIRLIYKFKNNYLHDTFEGREHWSNEKRDIFNNIILLTQEGACCTCFHGVSSHEINDYVNKINESIDKITQMELKNIENIKEKREVKRRDGDF